MQWFFTNLTPPGWAMQIIGGASERGKSTIRGAASRQRQSQKKSFIGPAAPQMQGPAIPERLRQKPNNLPPPLMIPSATVGGSRRKTMPSGLEAREFNTLKEEAKSADELMMISLNENLEKKIAELEAEREINELLIQRATLVANLVKASSMPTVYNELETQDAALQAILDKYPAIGSAADAAATLATSGISEMIAGTKSAEQVFVEFLSSIADALINTAKQMIAQYIAIGIAKMFAGLGGGGGGGGGGFAPSGPLAAVGNINPMPTSFTPFAEGGFVTGPTSAIIGEGGESEYVIPSSKMDAAMSRYSRGARGEGVIAGSGGSDSGDTAAAAGPIVVDVRYSVERINDVEYVTAAQFQAGMRQAAQQGAAQGEQRTLRRLQQSPSTRKRVGV
jgi:hypothetical protein